MTVRADGRAILLEGDCRVEDAEPLLNLLQETQDRPVDVSAMASIHTAVLQLLLVFHPKVVGASGDAFFETWIAPLLVTANHR
jgi:hypothetical protein